MSGELNGVGANSSANVKQQEAHMHADKAKEEASTAAGAAVNATTEAGRTAAAASRSAAQRVRGTVSSATTSVRNGFNSATSSVSAATQSFRGQVTDAYEKGKVRDPHATFTRNLEAKPTIGDRCKLALKFPFTTTSYVAGHTYANPTHTDREVKTGFTPKRAGIIGGAAAATWGTVLGLAGMAPSKLGFLIKPFPYAAGLSLVNLSAYFVYGSIAVFAAIVAVRIGVALVDKYKESAESKRQTDALVPPAPAAQEPTAPAADVPESTEAPASAAA